jgi:hypothetical protein
MITEDQSEVDRFLASPSTHGGAAVERIETHASIVYLAGPRALKLKRAVRYDYLDFSTADRRKAMCEAEFRINRRIAPGLYRGVVGVRRRADGRLSFTDPGTPVDWLVEMVRFDQDGLFDRLAAREALAIDLMRPLASAIARFHEGADRRPDHGGTAGMAWVADGNALGFAEQGPGVFDASDCTTLTQTTHGMIARHARLLDARRDEGFVRQCHGDLHLRNIVLWDDRPTLFDAVEFNDEVACIDVLYDLAFLLMDLWRRHLPAHANAVWNGYLFETADVDGIALLPLFLSCRAAVRAKTSATAANLQSDAQRRSELREAAGDYLAMARQLLAPPPACLIAVGGFSGSGKSTLAMTIAPLVGAVPGAVVIRSDEIRKRVCGVDSLQRLGPEGYRPEVTQQVYASLADRAAQVIRTGHAAIVDAVYARADDRETIERVAAAVDVPFAGLWLDAPEAALIARVNARRDDPSDADAEVIRRQIAGQTGAIGWRRVDASHAADEVKRNAAAVLRDRLPDQVIALPR